MGESDDRSFKISSAIESALNVTIIFYGRDDRGQVMDLLNPQIIFTDGKVHPLIDYYDRRVLDMSWVPYKNFHSDDEAARLTMAYPLRADSLIIVTHNRGLRSPLEKIYNYYGFIIVISTVIIITMTFGIIYASKGDLTFASFEILRLLVNTGIKTRITTDKMRLYFVAIFLYFLIIHGTFSGRLAGFLTKVEYRKNVETLEDLKDPQYQQIFAEEHAKEFIKDPVILNKTEFEEGRCERQIKEFNAVACILSYGKLRRMILKYNLHRIKEPLISTQFYSHYMRRSLPLKERINKVLITLAHSGLSDKWALDEDKTDTLLIRRDQELLAVRYRAITYDDLKFAFVLLMAGLTLALISFIFELFINWITKIRRRLKTRRMRLAKKNLSLDYNYILSSRRHPHSKNIIKYSKSDITQGFKEP